LKIFIALLQSFKKKAWQTISFFRKKIADNIKVVLNQNLQFSNELILCWNHN